MDRHTDDRQTDKVITDASSLLQHRLMVLSPDGSQKCGSLGNGIPPCPISSASDPLQDNDLLIHHKESSAKMNHLILEEHFDSQSTTYLLINSNCVWTIEN